MAESTQPRYLSHEHAQRIAVIIAGAVAGAYDQLVTLGCDPRGVDHEITMALARAAAARGMDVWPEAQRSNGHSDESVPPIPIGPRITGDWPEDLKTAARNVISGVRVEGAGSLTDLAIAELMNGWENGSVREFLIHAERYFAGLTMTIRKIERSSHTRIVAFHVGVG